MRALLGSGFLAMFLLGSGLAVLSNSSDGAGPGGFGLEAGPETEDDTLIPPERIFVHNSTGARPTLPPGYPSEFRFRISDTKHLGPEPSAGVDSQGRMFFQTIGIKGSPEDPGLVPLGINTLPRLIRSDDLGLSWQDVTPLGAAPQSNDPMLWLDPTTDRVYSLHIVVPPVPHTGSLSSCAWATWSDSAGDDWAQINPRMCRPLPEGVKAPLQVFDFVKLTTGPVPPAFSSGIPGLAQPPLVDYTNAVFLSWKHYGTLKPSFVAMSLDGGRTFPYDAKTFQPPLDGDCTNFPGRIRSLPSGRLLLPHPGCPQPMVLRSDDLRTWTSTVVGANVGHQEDRSAPELAVDTLGGAYLAFGAADNRVAVSSSTDGGETWGAASKASPPEVLTTTHASVVAGAPGRIAVFYYGNDHVGGSPDHVDDASKWHAYLSYSLDALSADPTWVTIQLDADEDPAQIGPIRTLSGNAPIEARNLLEFTDAVRSPEGAVVAAYADGCTTLNDCANNPAATPDASRDRRGIAAIQLVGPDLVPDAGVSGMLQPDGFAGTVTVTREEGR